VNMPLFSAEASIVPTGRRRQPAGLSEENQLGAVVPAQVACGTVTARCNGPFGARSTGFTSTTVVGGVPNRCGGAWQYAFTNVCRDLPTGAITSRTDGCGFCFF
jgi:hypothetical protein